MKAQDSVLSFASPKPISKNPVEGHDQAHYWNEASTNFESAEASNLKCQRTLFSPMAASPDQLFGSRKAGEKRMKNFSEISGFDLRLSAKQESPEDSAGHLLDNSSDIDAPMSEVDIGDGLVLGNYENPDQSLLSDVQLRDFDLQLPRHAPVEQDRFIPHRYANSTQSSNFEAKEMLFSKS